MSRRDFMIARSIAAQTPGVVRLILDLDVLSRSTLADLRIANARGEQIPYLVERCSEPLVRPLVIAPRRSDGTRSVYRVELPYATLPAGSRLVVSTSARVFERAAQLRRIEQHSRGVDADVLITTTWRSIEPDLEAPPLSLDLPAGEMAFDLVIDEGDNAALPLGDARLIVPSVALRFYHPGQPLTLLYGNARIPSPKYDLALLAPSFFAEPARDIGLASSAPPLHDRDGIERKIFWVAIALVAVVLLSVLARLLSAGPAEPA